MVKYWINNPSLNYGCVIRDNQENNTSQWTSFYSCDGTSSRIPELHIIYTEESDDPVVPGEGDDPTIPDPIIPPDEPDVNMPSVELLIQFDNKYAEVCAQESDGDYPETIQYLEEQKSRLQEYFMNNYGLIIWDHSDSYSVFDSYADQHEGDYVVDNIWCENSICTADGTIFLSEDHYTNLSNNLYRIENDSPGSVVILSYIGHNICQRYINEDLITVHEYNNVASEPMAGMALAIKSIMAVTDPRGTQWEAVTTIHEMGHMFMVQDHYGWNIELMPGQSDYCIYGNRKLNYNTVSSIVICDYCDGTIRNNIYRYGTN